MHFVHFLDPFYSITRNYAVLGIIFKVDDTVTTDIFDQINFTSLDSDSFANFYAHFDPIVSQGGFYHYLGSLTTPACNEVVKWFVLDKIQPIKASTYRELRTNLNGGRNSNR